MSYSGWNKNTNGYSDVLEKVNQLLDRKIALRLSAMLSPTAAFMDGTLDGLYLATSAACYVADASCPNPVDASHMVHAFYSPDNWEFIIPEMAFFTLYAVTAKMIAQQAEKKAAEKKENNDNIPNDKTILDTILAGIAASYPYTRDLLSGLKNGRHAVVNISILIAQYAFLIFNPIGLALGALLAVNLIYYRRMNTQRKADYAENMALKNKKESNTQDRGNIKRYSTAHCILNYCSAGFDGLTDGSYLYGCLISVLILCGVNALTAGVPLIIGCTIISILTAASFITKIHDEYQIQKHFKILELELDIQATKDQRQKEPLETKLEQLQSSEEKEDDPSYSSKITCIAYYLFRALISGAKNTNAAFKSLEALATNSLILAILTIGSWISTAGYTTYLFCRETYTGLQKGETAYGLHRVQQLSV